MKKYLKVFLIGMFLVLFSFSTASAKINDSARILQEGKACSSDAKLCPDGTSVGRVGPECEFAKCPEVKEDKNLQDEIETSDTDVAGQGSIETRREQIKTEIEKIRETAKLKMEDLKVKFQLEKNKVKAKLLEKRVSGREEALKRFDKAIERITNLKEKVNSQITKLDAKGIDTEKAKSVLATTDAKILEIKQKVAEVSTILASTTNELTKENKDKLRQLTKDTQDLIKETHATLSDAIKSLKTSVVKNPEKNTETEQGQ